MAHDCIFCGSSDTYIEHSKLDFKVQRCRACWKIEVMSGNMTEEQYEGGHWLDGSHNTPCFSHDFVETGTKRSWCRHCDVDGIYDIERGEYLTHDDLEIFQRLAKVFPKGDS